MPRIAPDMSLQHAARARRAYAENRPVRAPLRTPAQRQICGALDRLDPASRPRTALQRAPLGGKSDRPCADPRRKFAAGRGSGCYDGGESRHSPRPVNTSPVPKRRLVRSHQRTPRMREPARHIPTQQAPLGTSRSRAWYSAPRVAEHERRELEISRTDSPLRAVGNAAGPADPALVRLARRRAGRRVCSQVDRALDDGSGSCAGAAQWVVACGTARRRSGR